MNQFQSQTFIYPIHVYLMPTIKQQAYTIQYVVHVHRGLLPSFFYDKNFILPKPLNYDGITCNLPFYKAIMKRQTYCVQLAAFRYEIKVMRVLIEKRNGCFVLEFHKILLIVYRGWRWTKEFSQRQNTQRNDVLKIQSS